MKNILKAAYFRAVDSEKWLNTELENTKRALFLQKIDLIETS